MLKKIKRAESQASTEIKDRMIYYRDLFQIDKNKDTNIDLNKICFIEKHSEIIATLLD